MLTSYALKLLNSAKTVTSETKKPIEKSKPKKPIGRCPCGQAAYRKYIGAPACESCIRIEERFAYDTGKVGTKRTLDLGVDFYETGVTD